MLSAWVLSVEDFIGNVRWFLQQCYLAHVKSGLSGHSAFESGAAYLPVEVFVATAPSRTAENCKLQGAPVFLAGW